jgi:hypothetical protein
MYASIYNSVYTHKGTANFSKPGGCQSLMLNQETQGQATVMVSESQKNRLHYLSIYLFTYLFGERIWLHSRKLNARYDATPL